MTKTKTKKYSKCFEKRSMTTEEYARKSKEQMKPYNHEAYAEDKKGYLQKWL